MLVDLASDGFLSLRFEPNVRNWSRTEPPADAGLLLEETDRIRGAADVTEVAPEHLQAACPLWAVIKRPCSSGLLA